MPLDPTYERVVALLEAPKVAILQGHWTGRARESGCQIRAPLMINGIVEPGLHLHLQCASNRPDERVSISLLVETASGKPTAFARIDWRHNDHDNVSALAGDRHLQPAGVTHIHDPRFCQDIAKLREYLGKLPAAEALDPPPGDFRQLLEQASVLLNIINLTEVPIPPWQLISPLFPPAAGP